MDTIKNIFSPNIAKNDEAAHGSGRDLGSTTHTGAGGVSGEGSHLAESHNTIIGTSSGLPGSQASGIGEGSHFLQAHNTTARTSSGLIGNQTSRITNTSNTSTQNPAARDAAVAASGVGLAEHEHRKHESERGLGSTTTDQGFGNTQGVGSAQGAGYSSTPTNDLPILASMEAGGYTGTNQRSSYHTGPTGASAQGPHSTNTANRLDPAVNKSGTPHLENSHEHSEKHGGGGRAADRHHLDQHDGDRQTAEKHHLGRDAALGGGIGAATYLADKHHHRSEAKDSNPVTSASHLAKTAATTTTTTSGPQSSSIASTAGSSVDTTHPKDHHLGRDADIGPGAGAGAAGPGEREHPKRASEYYPHEIVQTHDLETTSAAPSSTKDPSLLPGPAPNTAGPHKKDWMNKLDPFVDSHPSSKTADSDHPTNESDTVAKSSHAATTGQSMATTSATSNEPQSSVVDSNTSGDHHYGRDAAIAGGVGGAAYRAETHHQKNEMNEPSASTLANPSRTATGQSTAATTTTTSGASSSIPDTNTSKDHHYGKDAVVAGGVGRAAYEVEKHHKHDRELAQAEKDAKKEHKHDVKEAKKELEDETKKEKKEREDSNGGLLGFLHRDKNKKYTPDEEAQFGRQEREHNSSHKECNTATAGAAAGAGALYSSDKHHYAGQTPATNPSPSTAPRTTSSSIAITQHAATSDAISSSHRYSKSHSGPTPLAEKPKGKDIGDILHGAERNRGVPGSSGYPGSEGFATGIGGTLAAKEAPQSCKSEATTDQSGASLLVDPKPELGTHLGVQLQTTDSDYAADENNHQTGEYDSTGSGSGLTGPCQNDHSYTVPRRTGLDTANEYRMQDTTSSLTESNTQSGFTGSNPTATCVNENSGERNRLHKDPPASHPAFQADVLASKDERE